MHTATPLVIAALLIAASLPANAQQRVYQWKDAQGVTHYTDIAPPQQHQTRDLTAREGNAPATVTDAKPDSKQCIDARNNLGRLQSEQAVGLDTNGDGTPDRNLSADERKSQLGLNQAAVKAYCGGGAN